LLTLGGETIYPRFKGCCVKNKGVTPPDLDKGVKMGVFRYEKARQITNRGGVALDGDPTIGTGGLGMPLRLVPVDPLAPELEPDHGLFHFCNIYHDFGFLPLTPTKNDPYYKYNSSSI
jgi:hypothetical protein